MSTVTISMPEDLERYIHEYLSTVRLSADRATGPVNACPRISMIQAKFLADVAGALSNITGADWGTEESACFGLKAFYGKAKDLNHLWAPYREMLVANLMGIGPEFGNLYPLPEAPVIKLATRREMHVPAHA
jgi:hypothetical protein